MGDEVAGCGGRAEGVEWVRSKHSTGMERVRETGAGWFFFSNTVFFGILSNTVLSL